MKLLLAVLAISILLLSETGFGPCPITGRVGAASLAAQKAPAKAAAPASGSALAADKGKLRILLEDQTVGSEEFEITPSGKDWVARGTTTLRGPGSEATEVRATMQLAADGSPISYEWSSKAQKKASASVAFKDGVAKISLNLEGATQPFVQDLKFDSPRIVVLDNNAYHHYAILARLYNWSARGAQTFQVLIPQESTPGTITVEDVGPQLVGGVALELLRAKTADLELELYVDSSHRLMRIAVPASKVAVVRE
jgi:hypothetical protein